MLYWQPYSRKYKDVALPGPVDLAGAKERRNIID